MEFTVKLFDKVIDVSLTQGRGTEGVIVESVFFSSAFHPIHGKETFSGMDRAENTRQAARWIVLIDALYRKQSLPHYRFHFTSK